MMGERLGGLRIQTINCLRAKNGQLEKTVAEMTEKIRHLESDNMSLREDLSKKSAEWEQKEKDMSAAVQKEMTRADEAERDASAKSWVWEQEKNALETSLDEERMQANSAVDELRRDRTRWEGDKKLLSADINKTKARVSELEKSLPEESAARGSLEEKLLTECKSASEHSVAQQAIIDGHLASIDDGRKQLEEMRSDKDSMAASLASAAADLQLSVARAGFSATNTRKLRKRITSLEHDIKNMACMVEILEAESVDLSRIAIEWEIHSRHSCRALNLHIIASWAAGVAATRRHQRLEDIVERCRLEIEAWEIMELETAVEIDEIKRRLRAYLFAAGAMDAVARRVTKKKCD
jgi:chromosome segregation ATPase